MKYLSQHENYTQLHTSPNQSHPKSPLSSSEKTQEKTSNYEEPCTLLYRNCNLNSESLFLERKWEDFSSDLEVYLLELRVYLVIQFDTLFN